jgi:hypothetical protein
VLHLPLILLFSLSFLLTLLFLQARHVPDANDAISVSSEKGVSVRVPAKGCANWVPGLAVESLDIALVQVSNDALAFEIPDLDGGVGTLTNFVRKRNHNKER